MEAGRRGHAVDAPDARVNGALSAAETMKISFSKINDCERRRKVLISKSSNTVENPSFVIIT
jgi:hypothetical protein